MAAHPPPEGAAPSWAIFDDHPSDPELELLDVIYSDPPAYDEPPPLAAPAVTQPMSAFHQQYTTILRTQLQSRGGPTVTERVKKVFATIKEQEIGRAHV